MASFINSVSLAVTILFCFVPNIYANSCNVKGFKFLSLTKNLHLLRCKADIDEILIQLRSLNKQSLAGVSYKIFNIHDI